MYVLGCEVILPHNLFSHLHRSIAVVATFIISYRLAFLFVLIYIDIELLLLFSEVEYRIRRREQAVESSRSMGVDYSCLFATGLLGGNHTSDKHRMVPPFDSP